MRLVRVVPTSVLLLASCRGEDLLLTVPEGEPAAIEILSGDAQAGRIRAALENPLVVRLTDTQDRPVANREVTFAVSSGGGSVTPPTAVSGTDGTATAQWTLGSAVGVQSVDARVANAQQPLAVRFLARGFEGLAIVGGDAQSAPVGSRLPQPLVVRVSDADNRPIQGLTITWAAIGGGSVDPTTTTTGNDGQAATERTLGPVLGAQSATASAPGTLGSVTFTHFATSGDASGILVVSGDNQTAPAGSRLPSPLVVRVLDAERNPVAGSAVSWTVEEGGGTVEPPSSVTDADGSASAAWTLGPRAGPNSVRAIVSRVSVVFSATATAPPAARLLQNGGHAQSGPVLSRLEAPLSVRAVDANGDGVGGVRVAWAVGSGSGSLSASTTTTRADGTADVIWTLGPVVGTQTATANAAGLEGSPVTFTATATVGPPSTLAIVTQPSSTAASGAPLAQQPVVELRDAAGNPVRQAGVNVTVAIASGGGTLGGSTTRSTNGEGRAVFTDLVISGAPGPRVLSFSAPGLSGVRSAPIQVGAGAPSGSRSSVSATPTSIEAGTGSSTVTVTVRDAQGTPLSGVSVQLSVSGSGNTITQPGTTNTNGVATGSFISTMAETKVVSATAGGVGIQQTATVTVTAPSPPGS
ncbi:MAG TPA: Ig-like domain-containing protein [Gemmatimonadales bacterium]|nr:Ig-like domain-containing protein [Gemmatimonadales bacterium]